MKIKTNLFFISSVFLLLIIVALCKETTRAALVQKGEASWIGERFQGRKTDSGEIFDLNDLTAFHESIDFGRKVKVTFLENNKSVIVKIIGRAPKNTGRVIDLSKRAASELGALDSLNRFFVKIEELSPYDLPTKDNNNDYSGYFVDEKKEETDTAQYYVIQYGSFWDLENAVQLKKSLSAQSILSEIATVQKEDRKLYRVNSLDVYPTSLEARCSLLFQKPQYGIIKSVDSQNNSTNLDSGEKYSEEKLTGEKNYSEYESEKFEYGIQFGAFQSEENAKQLQETLESGSQVNTIIHKFPNDEKNLFRVLSSSPFENRFEAENFLRKNGVTGVILTFVK